jgi:hypothetical protein
MKPKATILFMPDLTGIFGSISCKKIDDCKTAFSFVTQELTFPSLAVMLYTAGFYVKTFYIMPTECICVFCTVFRTKCNYFSIQNELTAFYD